MAKKNPFDVDDPIRLTLARADVVKLVAYLHRHMTPADSGLDQFFIDQITHQLH